MRNPMSFDGFLHHMVQELKAELLSGRIQKLTNPSSKNWCSKSRQSEKPKLLLSAHSVFGRIQRTRPTLKILPFPIPLLWLCANIFKALSSKGLSKWKTTGFSKSVSPIKRNWRCHFCQPHDWNHGQDTVILFSWTAPAIKLSKPLNMSASHKIATGPFSLVDLCSASSKTDAVNPFTIGDESFCPSSQGRVKPKNLQNVSKVWGEIRLKN